MDDLKYFPKDYYDSQVRFETLSRNVSGTKDFGRWQVPSVVEKDLAVDWLFLPAHSQPKNLFVLISGVHGPESYAGSAIQEMFIQEFLPVVDRENSGFFFVHSLNPYGFKHHTRCTEHKINLNRNCSMFEQMYSIRNPRSLELCKRFIPAEPVNSLVSLLKSKMRKENGGIFLDEVNLDEFIKATAIGQFESQEALEFGGYQPEPQIKYLTEKLLEIMPQYSDVIGLDLHTGLGHRGRLHLLTDENPRGLHQALLRDLIDAENDKDVYEYTPATEEGFYAVHGGTNNLFAEVGEGDQRVCAFTLEFGTLGHDLDTQLESLNQSVIEQQGSAYGFANEKIKKQVNAWTIERSYPSDPAWRLKVVQTSREFFKLILKRTNSLKA